MALGMILALDSWEKDIKRKLDAKLKHPWLSRLCQLCQEGDIDQIALFMGRLSPNHREDLTRYYECFQIFVEENAQLMLWMINNQDRYGLSIPKIQLWKVIHGKSYEDLDTSGSPTACMLLNIIDAAKHKNIRLYTDPSDIWWAWKTSPQHVDIVINLHTVENYISEFDDILKFASPEEFEYAKFLYNIVREHQPTEYLNWFYLSCYCFDENSIKYQWAFWLMSDMTESQLNHIKQSSEDKKHVDIVNEYLQQRH